MEISSYFVRARLLPLCVVMALAVGGCAKGGGKTADTAAVTAGAGPDATGVKPEDRFRVTADSADFFRYSPQQPAGADMQLKKDARVTKIRRLGGYTQIKTADNQTGYVASEDISQLSAQEIAAENAAVMAQQAPSSAFTTVGGQPVGGTYVMPSEAGRSEALPMPDAGPKPTPPPPTMFRY